MSSPSWANCSKVLGLLDADQRKVLQKVQNGLLVREIPAETLTAFIQHGLLLIHDGECLLTADGRLVVRFC